MWIWIKIDCNVIAFWNPRKIILDFAARMYVFIIEFISCPNPINSGYSHRIIKTKYPKINSMTKLKMFLKELFKLQMYTRGARSSVKHVNGELSKCQMVTSRCYQQKFLALISYPSNIRKKRNLQHPLLVWLHKMM